MEWLEVLPSIKAEKGRTTGSKGGLGDRAPIGRANCAFANSEGGVIIPGVDDAGTIVGVGEEPERAQKRLTIFLQSGRSFPVSARASRHQDPKERVHWIETPRQWGFEPLRYADRAWVRHERWNAELSPSELPEHYNIFGCILTEERMIRAASSAEINLAAFRARVAALHPDRRDDPQPAIEDDLRIRGVFRALDGVMRPTLYCVLAFGRDAQLFPLTAQFFIECAEYAGVDRASDVLLVGEGRCRIDEEVRRTLGWTRGLGRFETYRGPVRVDHPLVPRAALREALVTAVGNRDYEIIGSLVLLEAFQHRARVTSPGTIANHTTPESAGAGGQPRSRNELMANFMLVNSLMEQRGRGGPVVRRAMREFNGADAELIQNEAGRFVRVTMCMNRGSR